MIAPIEQRDDGQEESRASVFLDRFLRTVLVAPIEFTLMRRSDRDLGYATIALEGLALMVPVRRLPLAAIEIDLSEAFATVSVGIEIDFSEAFATLGALILLVAEPALIKQVQARILVEYLAEAEKPLPSSCPTCGHSIVSRNGLLRCIWCDWEDSDEIPRPNS